MADLHSFFKRKDPPGGAPGAALKAAKTSSASIAGGVRWSTLHGSLLARVDSASPPTRASPPSTSTTPCRRPAAASPATWSRTSPISSRSDAVRPKIRELHAQGVKIVVFSNQGGVKGAFEGKRAAVVRARIDASAADLQVPLDAVLRHAKRSRRTRRDSANPSRACGIISRARVTAGSAESERVLLRGRRRGAARRSLRLGQRVRRRRRDAFLHPRGVFRGARDHPPNDVETNKNEAKKQNSGGGADAVIVLDDEDDADAFDRENIP